MTTTHNLGFPRIGKKRELKFALEKYWRDEISQTELMDIAAQLRNQNWKVQSQLDWVPVGDFSLYDQVLDCSFMLGNIPKRAEKLSTSKLDKYFSVARGRSKNHEDQDCCIHAAEMTKWFDSNYHYIVPEFNASSHFQLNAESLIAQVLEAQQQGLNPKPVIIGPVSYLWLGKCQDKSDKLQLLDSLINIYGQLLIQLHLAGVEWVQIDEPVLVTELTTEWQHALRKSYYQLQTSPLKILLASYFGQFKENLQLVCSLPINGVHLDTINAADEVDKLVDWLPSNKVLSLGVINGRNIWKTDLNACLDWLEPIHKRLQERLWLAPSCSLLHVPVDLNSEQHLSKDIYQWLAFAVQKLAELEILAQALQNGRSHMAQQLAENAIAIEQRRQSDKVHNSQVATALLAIDQQWENRQSNYPTRAIVQKKLLNLPLFPTTTIGSFPQTKKIRQLRNAFRINQLSAMDYIKAMREEIKLCVQEQEKLGLDVLVHGEAERNDMVEYFGEQLDGFISSKFAWVQSYGSRCVKPPIIYGDISRNKKMTVEWIKYAQSLTKKPMKGMLTGPITILNWSFVRDDQARSQTAMQLALAIRAEVLDLEQAGIQIIQIDEAALREGLPLRKSQWKAYLQSSIRAFRVCANGVKDQTQIHTHMCYSEFNDIIEAIAQMDADVITIETSRSQMELLDAFDEFQYPNEIGPGVYDIHSPNIPSVDSIITLMKQAARRIPPHRLWINPDCGLKTRCWEEVKPALKNMVTAGKQLAANFHT